MGVKLILWFVGGVIVETLEGGGDVPQHGPVYLFSCIIPIKIYGQVLCALLIVRDRVVLLKDGHEVLDMLPANVFNAKIINAQGK